jgi:ribosomal protein S18 acetylase RimI-like enzyme
MSIHSRTFASEPDYEQMRQLVTEIYAFSGPLVYATPGDLDWWRFPHDDQGAIAGAQLWFDDLERLVAFAWPSGDQVDLFVHPEHANLYDEVLVWSEDHRLRTGSTDNDSLTLTARSFDEDTARRALLIQRGYQQTDSYYCQRARRLDSPLPIPLTELPAGYTLDHVHEEIIESRAAAQRDAFQSTKMTASRYRRLKEAPTYRPELDLVVRDEDGEVAAFATVWFDEANRAGTFEPVGTRSSQQRRGLARALLHEGLHRLQALGALTALVVSASDSEAANRLYDSCHLWIVGRDYAWTKRLPGNSD